MLELFLILIEPSVNSREGFSAKWNTANFAALILTFSFMVVCRHCHLANENLYV